MTTARSCRASTSSGTRSSASRCRCSLVRGATSPVVDDEDVAELLRRNPNARVVVVEGAGHSVQGDKPLELAEILRRFALASPDARTAARIVRRGTQRNARPRRARARAGAASRRRPHRARSDTRRIRHADASATASASASTASSWCTNVRARRTRVGITTLGAAAQFVGVPLGAPTERLHADDPVRARPVDRARRRHRARARGVDRVRRRRCSSSCARPTPRTTRRPRRSGPSTSTSRASSATRRPGTRATYGASPGDEAIAEPYLYVGPWDDEPPHGQARRVPVRRRRSPTTSCAASDDAKGAGMDFFLEGAALLLGQP